MATTLERGRTEFGRQLKQYFEILVLRGMEANLACALAFKCAAGITEIPPTTDAIVRIIEAAKRSGDYSSAALHLSRFFSSIDFWQAAFWNPQACTDAPLKGPAAEMSIHFPALRAFYTSVLSLPQRSLLDAVSRAMDQLLTCLMQLPEPVSPGLARQVAIMLSNPLLGDGEYHSLLASIAHFAVRLSAAQRHELVDVFALYPSHELKRVTQALQYFITTSLYAQQAITAQIEDATRLLDLVHQGNQTSGLLPPSDFYNDAVNHEDFNLKEDLRRWKHPLKYDFSFCQFPFLYDPASKARVLQMENQMAQISELQSALFRNLFSAAPLGGGDTCPLLVLKVRRGPYLVQDTLVQVHRAKEMDNLRKPLKVKFMGEEGVDEGGVQKEFFQLLVRELFNPDYGMFTADDRTRFHWFRPSHDDLGLEFELVGIMIGLAIYNAHILDFQFPLVLYKMLMMPPGGPLQGLVNVNGVIVNTRALTHAGLAAPPPVTAGVIITAGTASEGGALAASGLGALSLAAGRGAVLCLSDLQELQPEVCSSLGKLLACSPEEVDACCLEFQASVEMGFGEVACVDLVPGGANIPVTHANRVQYVAAYVHHLLQGCVARQFAAFQRGFLRLCGGAALTWFTPQELELLVCGGRQLDMAALQSATLYEDGYTCDSEPVHWFWEVVHSWGEEDKKHLLFFVTGSDRVPIKGLAALNPPFVISRAGAHSDRLPSAHTCFNHLLLPHYTSAAVLRERLELAIRHAEGFGLL